MPADSRAVNQTLSNRLWQARFLERGRESRGTAGDMFSKPTGNQSGTNGEPLKEKSDETGKKGTTKGGTNQQPIETQLETTGGTTSGTTGGTTKTNASLTKAPKQKRENASAQVLETERDQESEAPAGQIPGMSPEELKAAVAAMRKAIE